VPKSAGLVKQADWCQQAFLQEELQVLYVPIKGSVYGFRIDDGERMYNWEGLHKQLVTAVVHHPGSNHIITGSHDMTAKVCTMLNMCYEEEQLSILAAVLPLLHANDSLQIAHCFPHLEAPTTGAHVPTPLQLPLSLQAIKREGSVTTEQAACSTNGILNKRHSIAAPK